MRGRRCPGLRCIGSREIGSRKEASIDTAIETLSARLEERLVADGTPGFVVAITDRDRTLHVGAYGSADLASGTPMRIDHLLEIGSISKSFAAIVALQLRDEGLLDLDAPITDYVPWFEVQSEFGPITTHHLLTHTAGLISGSMGYYDARAEVWALRRTRAGAPPGSFFHYSNAGYQAVGLIISAVTGRPFHEELQRRLLTPLEMTSSEPNFTNDVRPRLAVGHVPASDDRPFVPGTSPVAPAPWFVGDTADGAICASADDMARYLRLWLSGGGGAYEHVITREAFRTMTTPALAPEGDGYGYGVALRSGGDRAVMQHGGGMVGYLAQLIADPNHGLGVVVLANGPAEVEIVAREAMDATAAERAGSPTPVLLDLERRDDVADTAQLEGEYRGPEGALVIEALGGGLCVRRGDECLRLRRVSPDDLVFVVDHPELGLAPFVLTRHDGGTIMVHGRHWYAGPGYRGEAAQEHPGEWDRFSGLYRAHNPWRTCVRFAVQDGAAWLVDPGWGTRQRLQPDGETIFRPAEDHRIPERVRFHSFAGDVPLCVEVDGFDYYRSADSVSCWNDTAE